MAVGVDVHGEIDVPKFSSRGRRRCPAPGCDHREALDRRVWAVPATARAREREQDTWDDDRTNGEVVGEHKDEE